LKVAARIDPTDREYYNSEIEPLLREAGSFVEFIGEVGGREKDEFLGRAAALLFPIDWPEPFGLVMIESLACGTPVIAWRNGSVSEVIDDGVTGFVVESVDEAVVAIARLSALDRADCRQVFEERFDVTRMARDYLKVYQRLKNSVWENVELANSPVEFDRARVGLLPTPRFDVQPQLD
jgi:glycosyltransferase involved in cell wall biosynthesis